MTAALLSYAADSPLVVEAEEAIRLVGVDPRQAIGVAQAVAGAARRSRDVRARSQAERALGLAYKELNEIPTALRHLRRAVHLGIRHGDAVGAAQARMSLAFVVAHAGEVRRALAIADRALPALTGADAARLAAQRALLLQRAGDTEQALAAYRDALPRLRKAGDAVWEARLLNNRGLLRAYRGELRLAWEDLRRCVELLERLGHERELADVRWNVGFVAGRRGDVPGALAAFDAADEHYRAHGVPRAALLLDRCEVLLGAGLFDEARSVAEEAVRELDERGMAADLAEARLTLAQAALAERDLAAAASSAADAERSFLAQGRDRWALVARYVGLRADAASHPDAELVSRLRRTADELAAAGWRTAALDARIVAARAALEVGDRDGARADLLSASAARSAPTLGMQARAWHAEALLRASAGDRRGALAAARAALGCLDRHRGALASSELRVSLAAHVDEVAALALRLAVESGDPRTVFDWLERWRAGALRVVPSVRSDDERLTDELGELRRVTAELDAAVLAGEPARVLEAERAAIERRIQARVRRLAGGRSSGERPVRAREIVTALPGVALVEYVVVDERLYAVTAARGRLRLHELGAWQRVVGELGSLQFALRRMAAGHGAARARAAAEAAATRLDAALVHGLAGELAGASEVVVVPTRELHAMPWALLPTFAGTPIVVSPSASVWLRGRTSRTAGPVADVRLAVVAGPRLPAAEVEATAVAGLYAGATVLRGDAATCGRALAALRDAGVAHIAAHGTFRSDNPLFSSFELYDGPLTVHDLQGLPSAPAVVVLSACHSGMSRVGVADDLLGVTAALLAQGTSSLVASVMPVPDAAAGRFMTRVHEELRRGAAPATALTTVQRQWLDGSEEDYLTAASFLCLGS